MTEASTELLPCPFCGGEASADGVSRYSKHHDAWFADGTPVLEAFFVNCVKCGIRNAGMIGHQTRDKAVAHWNTRQRIAGQAELREALELVSKWVGALPQSPSLNGERVGEE